MRCVVRKKQGVISWTECIYGRGERWLPVQDDQGLARYGPDAVADVRQLFTRADVWDAQLVLRWLTGSVSGASWPVVVTVTSAVAVIGVALAVVTRDLDLVELGPDLAAGLGSARRDDLLLALGVVLMAVAVAGAGPVPFVAFTAAPIARALLRGRRSLVLAAIVGAIVTVVADYLGSYLIADVSLPLGVVTGLAGAPVLIWFLVTGRNTRSAL